MNDQAPQGLREAKDRGARLKRIRNLANVSRKQLCEEASVNINTYIGYEVGRYGGITTKGAGKVLKYLQEKGVNCTIDWLMHETGSAPYVFTEKVEGLSFNNLQEESKIQEELCIFRSHYSATLDYRIIDDGMLPVYPLGSYVAGVVSAPSKLAELINSDCIVQLDNGDILVRKLKEGRLENTYTLACINPETVVINPILYNVMIVKAARIIWHRKACDNLQEQGNKN